jgi:exodeoxyribonuclease-5
MMLSEEQSQALDLVHKMLKTHPTGGGVGVISGFAGTGKTTILSELNKTLSDVKVITPTGKAALRVKEAAGILNVSTVHSWLYEVVTNKFGTLEFTLRNSIETPECGLVVVDEASMVTLSMFRDIYAVCKRNDLNLLLVGDPFQLPPVEKNKENQSFTVFDPSMPVAFRAALTKVHRQALDSPIVRVSMQIRNDWSNIVFDGLEVRHSPSMETIAELAQSVWEETGATICHKNSTRNELNRAIRQAIGLKGLVDPDAPPKLREPLLVTQNDYSIEVYNGEITDILVEPELIPDGTLGVKDPSNDAVCLATFFKTKIKTAANSLTQEIVISDVETLGKLGDVSAFFVKKEYNKLMFKKYGQKTPKVPYIHTALGYVLTAHKSQGSEFPSVLVVVEPSVRLNTEAGRRWAYTSITRAKQKCSLVFTE